MKILIIGGGGREHALVWKLARSPKVSKLYAIPGSDAISELAECVSLPMDDMDAIAQFAADQGIDLTMVGPEDPLTKGIVDAFDNKGLKIVGPSALAARIEGSKVFSKDLMKKYNIPSADYISVSNPEEARAAVDKIGLPLVVKADGLAAGKGVLLCYNEHEAENAINEVMVAQRFGSCGENAVIEKLLVGEEASFIAFTDGETVLPMASSQDHKRVFNDDKGLNTGGMGAYSPAPVVDEAMHNRIMETVMIPTVRAMKAEGCPFKGVLYAGLMISEDQINVLEFNARFGDPETQPIMVRLKSDLVDILEAVADGTLADCNPEWDPRPSVCVVMASGGYPGSIEKGNVISGLDDTRSMEDVTVFHAGTKKIDGNWTNSGGRVLGVTALGDSIEKAIAKSYEAVNKISWKDVHFRTDIAKRALGRM